MEVSSIIPYVRASVAADCNNRSLLRALGIGGDTGCAAARQVQQFVGNAHCCVGKEERFDTEVRRL